MDNKINISELLKDCPSGMELDCASYDNVSFDKISDDKKATYPIFCYITDKEGNRSGISFTENGCESKRYGAKCVIFPKGKTTWEGFQRPFKDGDILYCDANDDGDDNNCYKYVFILKKINKNKVIAHCFINVGRFVATETYLIDNSYPIRFATEEEKEKLFQAIKDNGYKWDEETKTLGKLIEPKFHEGEWLCVNKPNDYAYLVKIIKVVEVFGKKRYKVSRDYDSDLDVVECDFIEKNYHLWTIEDAKDGDVLVTVDDERPFIYKGCLDPNHPDSPVAYCGIDSEGYFICSCVNEFNLWWTENKVQPATKEQYDLLFQKIKEAGYEWNLETKTLEKLVEPKFKVGDRIKSKEYEYKHTITKVCEDHYELDDGTFLKFDCQDKCELVSKPKFKIGDRVKNKDNYTVSIVRINDEFYNFVNEGGKCGVIFIKNQDNWELVSNDFDFSKLVPFESKVLVRNDNEQRWIPAFWGGKREDGYVTTFGWSKYCVPYEGNEHLLRTSE